MEIEIITTKKKLHNHHLNQMPLTIEHEIMVLGKPLGYIDGVHKYCERVYLLFYKKDYYLLPGNIKADKTDELTCGWWSKQSGPQSFRFKSKKIRDGYLKDYEEMKKDGNIHIYT